MYFWVLFMLACLGSAIFGGIPGLPFDMRLPALLFGALHLVAEKFDIWDDESFWISLAMICTIADFFVPIDLNETIGFWLVAFHILQHGAYRGTV